MLLNSNDGEKLFSKTVPVSIKDGFTNQIRTSRLLLSIEWQEISSGIYRKELVVSLTDNNDPFFLYNLHLCEEDFQNLKTCQGLLVDFPAFPQKFIELVELCLREESNTQPKFILSFNVDDKLGNISSPSNLDIIETNPFKHLTHLSLKLVAASEAATKQYLVSCFRSLKEEKLQLQNRLTYIEKDFTEKLSASQETLKNKIRENEATERDFKAQLSTRENQHSKELQEEKEKYLNKQKEEELQNEKEKENFRKKIQKLESRVTALDTLNKEIQDKNFRNDNTIRDLKSDNVSLKNEIKKLNENLHALKSQKEKLESEIKQLGRMKNKMEKDLCSQKDTIHKQQDEIEVYQQEKKEFETLIEKLNVQINVDAKSQESFKEDLVKANDIIIKLQEEVKFCHDKIKENAKMSSKQENFLLRKEKIIESLREKDLKESQELVALKSKINALSDTVTSLKEKNKSIEKELKTKESVIKWLNRQMTDRCIVPQYVPPSNIVPSPPNIGQLLTKYSSPNSDKSPKIFTSSNTAPSKLALREENQSPVLPKNISSQITPFKTPSYASDSAYETSQSCATNQMVSSIPKTDAALKGNELGLDIDQSALNAAFGNDCIIKHSTAKKQSNGKISSKTKKT